MTKAYNNSLLGRTISVSGIDHTSVSGLLTATSGNFTNSLQVNGTGVSVSGHSHVSTDISDSTTAGRALLTGADAATQRTSLGLGTIATQASGSYALTSHTHTASNISDSTTAGRSLLTGTDATAQRTSLGLGTIATEASGNYAL